VSPKSTRLYLVRHAQTAWNAEGRFQGQSDVPLSQAGVDDCLEARSAVQGLDLTAAYSSPLSRAKDTASSILHNQDIELHFRPDLMEINLGDLEGVYATEAREDFPEVLKQWKEAPSKVQMPKGESLRDVQSRVAQCIGRIIEDNVGGNVLIVAHGFALLSFVCHVLELPLDNFRHLHLDHLGLTQVEILPERTVLRRFNVQLSENTFSKNKLPA